MSNEKLIDGFSIKCTADFKDEIELVAAAYGLSLADFVRIAVTEKLASAKSMYEALHKAYGNSKESETHREIPVVMMTGRR